MSTSSPQSDHTRAAADAALLAPNAFEQPQSVYKALLDAGPIFWSDALRCWIVVGRQAVTTAFRSTSLSSARLDHTLAPLLCRVPAHDRGALLRISRRFMSMTDPPTHAAVRRWGARGFTQAQVVRWAPVVQRISDELLARSRGAGRADLVRDWAELLPARTIADMFGVAEHERSWFLASSAVVAEFFAAGPGELAATAPAANRAITELEGYFVKRLATAGREASDSVRDADHHEGHDLIGALARGDANRGVPDASEPYDAAGLAAQCVALVVGGNITTADQLSNAVHALLTHPVQLDRLRADAQLIDHAVEELVRWDPSVPFMHRIVRQDVELLGSRLRAGEVVLLGIGPANHDPCAFASAAELDLARDAHAHVGYGYGRHVCLGMNAARVELKVGLESVLGNLSGLRLDPARPPVVRDNLITKGFSSLPVLFDPTQAGP